MRTADVKRLLKRWQHKMRLDDWDIRYSPDADAGDDLACIEYQQLIRTATLALDNSIGADVVELYIAHELAHLLVRDFCDMAYADLLKPLVEDEKTLAIYAKLLADEEEKVCWTIAKILFVEDE